MKYREAAAEGGIEPDDKNRLKDSPSAKAVAKSDQTAPEIGVSRRNELRVDVRFDHKLYRVYMGQCGLSVPAIIEIKKKGRLPRWDPEERDRRVICSKAVRLIRECSQPSRMISFL